MELLIDTSVLIDLERQRGSAFQGLRERFGDQPVALASITASELLHGVHRADTALRRGRRERFVEESVVDGKVGGHGSFFGLHININTPVSV